MGDWPVRGDIQRRETIGTDAANSYGKNVVTGINNIKGAYTVMSAATAFDAQGFWVVWMVQTTTNVSLLDVAVGAALSEQVIVSDLIIDSQTFINVSAFFPIAIPAGTRVACRGQTSGGAGKALKVTIILAGQSFLPSSPLGRVVTMGVNTGTSLGTVIDPGGVAHTKGGWIEIEDSTTADFKELIIMVGGNDNTAQRLHRALIDVAIGAGGSEQIIIADLQLACHNGSDTFSPGAYPLMGCNIPAGTRIAAQAQSSTTDATDRLFTIALYGIG